MKNWSGHLTAEFATASTSKKLAFLLGINKFEKSNPLHELNTHISSNLIFIKTLYEKIEHTIEDTTILSSTWNGYFD